MPLRTDARRLLGRTPAGHLRHPHPLSVPPAVLKGAGLLLAVVVGVLAVLGVGLHGQRTLIANQQTIIESLGRDVQALAALPTAASCMDGTEMLIAITSQQQDGDHHLAAQNAETALNNPSLCPSARSAFAGAAVAAHLADLLGAPLDPADYEAQALLVARYEATKALARRHDVALPSSPHQVARTAFHIQAFLLAKHAFEEASANQTHLDPDHGRFYADVLYTLGVHTLRQPTARAQHQAWGLVAASHGLSRHHHLGRGEAEALLRQHFGDDEHAWPAPAPAAFLPARSANKGSPR